jgi:polyhydroxyalkanoate synthase
MVEFAARQWLDMMSPANAIATNPEVLRATASSGGLNLAAGAMNFLDDAQRQLTGKGPAGAEGFASQGRGGHARQGGAATA